MCNDNNIIICYKLHCITMADISNTSRLLRLDKLLELSTNVAASSEKGSRPVLIAIVLSTAS